MAYHMLNTFMAILGEFFMLIIHGNIIFLLVLPTQATFSQAKLSVLMRPHLASNYISLFIGNFNKIYMHGS